MNLPEQTKDFNLFIIWVNIEMYSTLKCLSLSLRVHAWVSTHFWLFKRSHFRYHNLHCNISTSISNSTVGAGVIVTYHSMKRWRWLYPKIFAQWHHSDFDQNFNIANLISISCGSPPCMAHLYVRHTVTIFRFGHSH